MASLNGNAVLKSHAYAFEISCCTQVQIPGGSTVPVTIPQGVKSGQQLNIKLQDPTSAAGETENVEGWACSNCTCVNPMTTPVREL